MADTAIPSTDVVTTAGPGALPGPPPPVGHWATRADLLRDRAAAVRVLHKADMAMITMLRTGLLLVPAVVSFTFCGAAFVDLENEDGEPTPRGVAVGMSVVLVLVGMFFTFKAYRRMLRARDIGRARCAWERLAHDPAARALPRGDLDPDLREAFDARVDPDADVYIPQVIARLQTGPVENRLLARAAITGLAIVPGLALALAPVVSRDPMMVGMPIAGSVWLTACGIQVVKGIDRGLLYTRRWSKTNKEYAQWRAERSPATP